MDYPKLSNKAARLDKLQHYQKHQLDANQQLQAVIAQQQAKIFQLESVIEQLPGSIYWKDKDGVYLGRNTYNMQKMHSVHLENHWCKTAVIGKTDYALFPAATADLYRKHDAQVMQTRSELSIEEPVTLPDGSTIVQLSTKKPLYDQLGEVVGIIGNTVDITYIKTMEQELRQAKELAEQANLIKTAFMRNMEHDLRTPFNGILGITSCLYSMETDPSKKKYLKQIVDSAQELLNYCNSILDFSKIEAGMLRLVHKKFNLKKLVDELIKIELPAAQQKNLELKLNYDLKIPSIVTGDAYRLQRILINLLSNAIKFTASGQVTLTVALLQQNPSSVLLRFIIQDTGPGIADYQQDYIFEKFSRLTPANQGIYKGVGLGLRIVKQFMHEMGGEIDLQSKLGQGTEFICSLPFLIPLTNDFVTETTYMEYL